MDRQAHDYANAAAMAFAQQQQQANIQQQQQQFGYHPQHQQQYPPSVHGPPFLPPHPSLQQFPFHRHMQQPPPQPQLQSHPPPPPPHPHLLHLQQQQQQPPPSFPPHLPPHHIPSPPFHGGYDSLQPPPPPPSDPELQKCIDKLVEYSAKNGPEFEAMIREKQQDNPTYSFLFGGEGHNYYRYKLWVSTRPPSGLFNPPFPSSSMTPLQHPPNSMMNPSPLNASASPGAPTPMMGGAPQMHQPPFPPFYDQHHQHSQSFVGHGRPDYDQSSRSFKGLSGPLPSDVAMELNNVLNSLTGTKESIKGAKIWFMQRSPFAPALAEALRDRVIALDDSERQLHIIYLANDILFDSLQRRINPHELDNEALAFKPVLGSMLARIYHNPQNKEDNQSRLQKILQFWASKEVYDHDTIRGFENEMLGGPPTNPFPGPLMDLTADPSLAGLSQLVSTHGSDPHANDKQVGGPPILQGMLPTHHHHQHYLPPGGGGFLGSMPMPPSSAANQQTEKLAAAAPPPPYPLFPPGLIPGMVRKMQIGSGVPYSPMSPLDIPTAIPPSTVSPSQILERVSKFFKDIGEVNPSEGPMHQPSGAAGAGGDENEEYDDYERDASFGRKGGACIPPPPNLQVVDPETGTYPDGSVDQKPGSSGSSSGRLGLGATANPNEASQYDDVYSSYRKQRSTNYHTSMSARASATK